MTPVSTQIQQEQQAQQQQQQQQAPGTFLTYHRALPIDTFLVQSLAPTSAHVGVFHHNVAHLSCPPDIAKTSASQRTACPVVAAFFQLRARHWVTAGRATPAFLAHARSTAGAGSFPVAGAMATARLPVLCHAWAKPAPVEAALLNT